MKFIRRMLLIFLLIIGFFVLKNSILSNSSNSSNTQSRSYTENQIEKPVNVLLLVNRQYPLSEDYEPLNLVKPDVRFAPNTSGEEELMESQASEALEKLFNGAEKEEIRFYCVSGYRSYDLQRTIYKNRINAVGKAEADKYVAQPGHSEHQTGLAMDLTNKDGVSRELTGDFGKTKEGIWLKNNAYEYGFIIRYLKGKEDITGYSYEPWHIRYVGEKAAKKIKNSNIVFEEYMENYDSAVADGIM